MPSFLDLAQSQPVTLSVTVEENPTVSAGKRKRAVGDLADYVPGQLGGQGKEMVAATVSIPSLLTISSM